jgi:hypothetical protein
MFECGVERRHLKVLCNAFFSNPVKCRMASASSFFAGSWSPASSCSWSTAS